MINKYDVFLFDFDGTLFDTLESSIYVFEEAYSHIGVSIKREDILGYTREPIPVSYQRVMGSLDGYPEFIKDIDRLIFSQKVTDLTEIYEDTARILHKLKDEKKIIGIVTSNSRIHVLDILKKYHLETIFDVIVGNVEAPNPKPSPEPILKAIELLGYKGSKNKIAYIGDSLNDMLAAKNAEVVPVLIDRLHEFADKKEYVLINTLDDIVR